MKKLFVKRKLAILSSFAMLAYCVLIMNSFADGWDDFKLGFKEGSSSKIETYFLDLKTKDGYLAFPDSIQNIKTKENVKIRYNKAQVQATIINKTNKSILFYSIIEVLMIMITFFIVAYIPILFFRLMRTLMNEVVFDNENIKYLRRIGVSLLIFYFINFGINNVLYLKNQALFEFSNYTIQRESTDVMFLLLGFVVLIFAEIISKGSRIKEDQDLTI